MKRCDIHLEQYPRAKSGLLVCTVQLQRQLHATRAFVTLKHHRVVVYLTGTLLCFTWNPSPKPAHRQPHDNPTSKLRAVPGQWLSPLKTKTTWDFHGYHLDENHTFPIEPRAVCCSFVYCSLLYGRQTEVSFLGLSVSGSTQT